MTAATRVRTGAAVLAGAWLSVTACASVSFIPVTWEPGGNTMGWTNAGGLATGVGTIGVPATGGDPAAYLRLLFPADPFPVIPLDSMVAAGEGYTGDYISQGSQQVVFDFLGYPTSPQAFYFASSAGGGSWWEYTFTSSDHVWETHAISFRNPDGWTQVSGSTDFITALSQVDLIGIVVQHLNLDDPLVYGLDNWQFQVPEPSEWAMLGVALLSVGAVFRKDLLAALRPRRNG